MKAKCTSDNAELFPSLESNSFRHEGPATLLPQMLWVEPPVADGASQGGDG